jgi:hypothetical protein
MKKPEPIEPGRYNGILVHQAYNPIVDKLKSLDFFCVAGRGWVSKGIRVVTKNLSADRDAEFNHAGIFPFGNECTLEALWTLTSTNFFDHYENSNCLIARWNKMDDEARLKAFKATNKHIGQKYPTYRLAFHLINVAQFIHWTNSLVCSEYVAKILFHAGARHHHYYGTTPDALADEVERELNKERTGPKYSIIYKGLLPFNYYFYCTTCKTYWLVPLHQYFCPTCRVRLSAFPVSQNKELDDKIELYNVLKKKYVESELASS